MIEVEEELVSWWFAHATMLSTIEWKGVAGEEPGGRPGDDERTSRVLAAISSSSWRHSCVGCMTTLTFAAIDLQGVRIGRGPSLTLQCCLEWLRFTGLGTFDMVRGWFLLVVVCVKKHQNSIPSWTTGNALFCVWNLGVLWHKLPCSHLMSSWQARWGEGKAYA